jgi:hypothetical protein
LHMLQVQTAAVAITMPGSVILAATECRIRLFGYAERGGTKVCANAVRLEAGDERSVRLVHQVLCQLRAWQSGFA